MGWLVTQLVSLVAGRWLMAAIIAGVGIIASGYVVSYIHRGAVIAELTNQLTTEKQNASELASRLSACGKRLADTDRLQRAATNAADSAARSEAALRSKIDQLRLEMVRSTGKTGGCAVDPALNSVIEQLRKLRTEQSAKPRGSTGANTR